MINHRYNYEMERAEFLLVESVDLTMAMEGTVGQYDDESDKPVEWAKENREAIKSLAESDLQTADAAKALLAVTRGEQPDPDHLIKFGVTPPEGAGRETNYDETAFSTVPKRGLTTRDVEKLAQQVSQAQFSRTG